MGSKMPLDSFDFNNIYKTEKKKIFFLFSPEKIVIQNMNNMSWIFFFLRWTIPLNNVKYVRKRHRFEIAKGSFLQAF